MSRQTEKKFSGIHESVMMEEALASWLPSSRDGFGKQCFIDATYGRGGHTLALLDCLAKSQGQIEAGVALMVIDKDLQAIEHAQTVSKPIAEKLGVGFYVQHGSFADTFAVVKQNGWVNQVDGILLDLGVSSPQLDEAERGFSFNKDGPLDMRMDTSNGMSAAQWLMSASESEIRQVLWDYGEEKQARRIAREIVSNRLQAPIERTKQLADLISNIMPRSNSKKHPATRSFQAIRIFINNELIDIKRFLSSAIDCLKIGGRLVVISFHSLEDRMIKRFMQKEAKGDPYPRDFPIRNEELKPRLKILVKGEKPKDKEVQVNARARSAILRVAEKQHH